jgi:hypothetical protein
VPFTILQQNGKLKKIGDDIPNQVISQNILQNSMIPISLLQLSANAGAGNT